jgi:hypothetical protein
MGAICCTNGGNKKCINCLTRYLKTEDHLEDLGIDENIILTCLGVNM